MDDALRSQVILAAVGAVNAERQDGPALKERIAAAIATVNAEGPSDVPYEERVAAAVAAQSPSTPAYEERVAAAALRIAAMLGENSLVSRALDSFERCDGTFVATPVNAKIEQESSRRFVYFETTDRETGEKKVEFLRTERVDDPLGRLVFAQAKACKGQPVRVYKEVEATGKMKDGHPVKVRMLRWLEPV